MRFDVVPRTFRRVLHEVGALFMESHEAPTREGQYGFFLTGDWLVAFFARAAADSFG